MTRIKLCGLTRLADMQAVNALRPDYAGFVFYPKSSRFVTPERAVKLRETLDPSVRAVGVFVDEPPESIAALLESGAIDIAQLHGREDTDYLRRLRELTEKPVIKAFRVQKPEDCLPAETFPSDCVLLDSGMGRFGAVCHDGRDATEEYAAILSLPGLDVEGVFTHFAVSEIKDPSYTREQFSSFVSTG